VLRTNVNNRKKDVIMTRLRIGHTAVNQSLHKIGKHESGNCDKCGYPETVKHILLECVAYRRERLELIQSLNDRGVRNYTLKELLEGTNYTIHEKFSNF